MPHRYRRNDWFWVVLAACAAAGLFFAWWMFRTAPTPRPEPAAVHPIPPAKED